MGEPKSAVNLVLPTSSPTITVTHVITQAGQTEPVVDTIETTGNQVSLTIGESPVFVEGIQPQTAPSLGEVFLPLVLKDSE
jgi:hypothetical protein